MAAINQLVAINQGVNGSEFTYDRWGKRVRMVEKVSGATTSDRRFVWCGIEICEERDSLASHVFHAVAVLSRGPEFVESRQKNRWLSLSKPPMVPSTGSGTGSDA